MAKAGTRAGVAAAGLVGEHLSTGGPCGVNAYLKVACLVAGMAAGAVSLDDLGVLRHGAMSELFTGIRAPSTLGSFLRSFTWGSVRHWMRWPAGNHQDHLGWRTQSWRQNSRGWIEAHIWLWRGSTATQNSPKEGKEKARP